MKTKWYTAPSKVRSFSELTLLWAWRCGVEPSSRVRMWSRGLRLKWGRCNCLQRIALLYREVTEVWIRSFNNCGLPQAPNPRSAILVAWDLIQVKPITLHTTKSHQSLRIYFHVQAQTSSIHQGLVSAGLWSEPAAEVLTDFSSEEETAFSSLALQILQTEQPYTCITL